MPNGDNVTDAQYAALCGQYHAPQKIRVTSTQNNLITALSGRYYTLCATVDTWYRFDVTDVSILNGVYLPAGAERWIAMRGETNAAFITDGPNGYIDVTKKG